MARSPLLAVIALSLLAPVAAAAQSAQGTKQRVSITADDCRRLVAQVPSADVAYTPGVDVHGRPVAPADLPGSGGTMQVLPKELNFDYTINPTAFMNKAQGATASSALAASSNTMMSVAKIHFDLASGQLTINGQPVDGTGQQAIAAECRKHGFR